jgi:hypothetical protein
MGSHTDNLLCAHHHERTKETMKPNYIPNAFNYTSGLCDEHAQPDCGCPGYPTLQEQLIDCGDPTCYDGRRWNTCLQHQAANMIERYKVRSERYLERIIYLQDIIERQTEWWNKWGEHWKSGDDMTEFYNENPKPWDQD